MSATEGQIDIEEFRKRAAQAGLVLDEEEVAIMYEGYLGLQTLLGRLPSATDFADEPASVFVGPGTRVIR